jgi:hypothetical protein
MRPALAVSFSFFFLLCSCSTPSGDGDTSQSGEDTTDGEDTQGDSTGDVADGTVDTKEGDGDTGTDDGNATTTLYKGAFAATVTTDGITEDFAGKIELKLRADGLFSGSGSGANTANEKAISLELHGNVNEDDEIAGEVTWQWVDDSLGANIACTLSSNPDEGFSASFTGGDQQQNVQGSFTLSL